MFLLYHKLGDLKKIVKKSMETSKYKISKMQGRFVKVLNRHPQHFKTVYSL